MSDDNTSNNKRYEIPDDVKKKFPDLQDLITNSESMNEDEKDYWVQILPVMTEQQIVKLRNILLTEKQQLEQIDKEYQEDLNKLTDKHMIEWQELKMREKQEKIRQAEAKSEAEEEQKEAELLAKLSNL